MKIQLSSHQTSAIGNLKVFKYTLWCIVQYLCINIQLCYVLDWNRGAELEVKHDFATKGACNCSLIKCSILTLNPNYHITFVFINFRRIMFTTSNKCYVFSFLFFDLERLGLPNVADIKTASSERLMQLCLHLHLLESLCNFSIFAIAL